MIDSPRTEEQTPAGRELAPEQTLRYGADPDQIADFRSGSHGQLKPLLILIHGGYWKPEYDRLYMDPLSAALAKQGWSVLTLEYRRQPGNPDATLDDVKLALQTLPGMITQHNGRQLLLGHSAGGHLALWLASSNPPALQGVLALAPAANLGLVEEMGLGNGAVARFLGQPHQARPDIDPMQRPAPTVPVSIIQGGADTDVPPAIAESYCQVFQQTRLCYLPEMEHFGLVDPDSDAWPVLCKELENLS